MFLNDIKYGEINLLILVFAIIFYVEFLNICLTQNDITSKVFNLLINVDSNWKIKITSREIFTPGKQILLHFKILPLIKDKVNEAD